MHPVVMEPSDHMIASPNRAGAGIFNVRRDSLMGSSWLNEFHDYG